ncbi:carbohydrate ABC transporter substrate-binding protein [Acidaminobacter sp. JC074]|uniref:ABC transporter substrate-binding protein n=1 Tax=Acidaminobacter sp. JC074 TaxID=2530199 RepID=UPI001F118A6F|nr:ABC transporter substrate-binding protein [Acidaminobacter sp. JC074]MCH4890145.1 carbohydrate ABC transporter substrate-binding protein [Acidaminobacter sp. JC074]
MKKFLVIMLSVLLAFTSIGCSSSDTNAGGETPKELTLSYQYWDLIPNQEEVFAEFTKQYEAESGIKVTIDGNLVGDAGWQDILKTQVAAGNGPDVFHMDLNEFSAWRDVVIQPISPYIDQTLVDEFVPSAVGVWKADDKLYALPNSFSVVAFLYNKEMFEKAGLDVSGQTRMTLEDFENTMDALYNTFKDEQVKYEEDGENYQNYVVGTRSLLYWWWLFNSYGGESLDTTNNIAQEAYVDAIMKIAEYADKGWITNASDVMPGGVTNAFGSAGNVAIYPTGDWTTTGYYRTQHGIGQVAKDITTDFGSLTVPLGSDGKVHAEMYNQGVVMNKNIDGAKAEAAAAFIEYMTTSDAWLKARGPEAGGLGIPGRKEWADAYSNTWFEKPEQREAFVWEANNGVITSPDYQIQGIDLYSFVQEAITLSYDVAIEEGQMDYDAVRKLVIESLEKSQESINLQLKENGLEIDNPEAKVK